MFEKSLTSCLGNEQRKKKNKQTPCFRFAILKWSIIKEESNKILFLEAGNAYIYIRE